MLLGGLGDCDDVRFGGTQYAKSILDALWGLPPALDMDYEKRVQAAIRRDRERGPGGIRARSQRWRARGGAGRMLLSRRIGARSSWIATFAPEFLLFHEGLRGFWFPRQNPDRVQSIARDIGGSASSRCYD